MFWFYDCAARAKEKNSLLNPLLVEVGPLARAVGAQRAVRPRGVRAVENPVLPGGQPPEDLRLDGLRAGEPVVGLEAGQRVGGERRALLDRDPHFLVPVDVIG